MVSQQWDGNSWKPKSLDMYRMHHEHPDTVPSGVTLDKQDSSAEAQHLLWCQRPLRAAIE